MSKPEFKLDVAGLNELMKSAPMQAHLTQAGNAVASAAGGEYGVRTHTASFVAIANVFPESKQAAKDTYEKNTLVKALRAAGLRMQKG